MKMTFKKNELKKFFRNKGFYPEIYPTQKKLKTHVEK